MSICKLCGAEIEWIYTQEKQYRPVDPCPVFVIEGEGTERFSARREELDPEQNTLFNVDDSTGEVVETEGDDAERRRGNEV